MADQPDPTRDQHITNPDYALAPATTHKERRAKRQELRGSGLRGAKLRGAMKDYRSQARDARDTDLVNRLGEDNQDWISNPEAFLKHTNPQMRRLLRLRVPSHALGYDKDKERLQGEYGRQFDALAGEAPDQAGSKIEVERDFQEAPTFSNFQDYVSRHLNPETGEAVGLTPNEENSIRGRGLHSINDQARQAETNTMTRLAAAGMDPRSGVAQDQQNEIDAARANSRYGLESNITDANLARKQQFEGYAQDLGRAEEQRRQFDVSGDLRRLGDVEQGEQNLANLGENQRQFDFGFSESRRQAALARKAAAKAAKDLEPSTLDKVVGGIGGFLGGLTGGGGGGGGGGMLGGLGK